MTLHRGIKVTQKMAWFMLHRIREAWRNEQAGLFSGPVEKTKRANLEGRGAVGKTAVVGVKDRGTNKVRASVIEETDAETLHGFIGQHAVSDATVYTDDAKGMPHAHESVTHNGGHIIHETLTGMNYGVSHRVLNAAAWVPQHRQRVFIVAWRDGGVCDMEAVQGRG